MNALFASFFNDTATTEIYALSLHDALPISGQRRAGVGRRRTSDPRAARGSLVRRSEEHTSELQSHVNLVCRLLLEKKKSRNIRGRPDVSRNRIRVKADQTVRMMERVINGNV